MNYTYYRRYQPSKKRNSGFKSFFWLVIILVVILLVLRACISIAGSMLEEKKDEATLTLYKGDAEVLEWGQTEVEEASDAQLILEGDQVNTLANSWATLEFYDGSKIRLDQNTKLVLTEVNSVEESEQVLLELIEGRIWIYHELENEQSLDIQVNTAVMDIQSVQGQYLLAHQGEQEALFVYEGPVTVEYMDRSGEARVIETMVLKGGEMSLLDETTQAALQARENVTLVEPVREDMFTDSFVRWSKGEAVEEEPVVESEVISDEEVVEEVVTEDPVVVEEPVIEPEITTGLKISIISPASGSTIQKDAIALEGQILSGMASTVTVTWSGNGVPYTLSGFTAGNGTFRYVADTDYANYSVGSNTYTIVAYDENGQPSNTVVITLNAEF
ncbi:MAG: FecR family protein [Candidatus Gracilibacteria bacterium]